MMRSTGTLSQAVRRAMLSASGLPVPFSMRESVEAETLVSSATSRNERPASSRLRRIARPSSTVFTKLFPVEFAIFGLLLARFRPKKPFSRSITPRPYHKKILVARLCFILATSQEQWYTVSRMKQQVAITCERLGDWASESRVHLGDIRQPFQDGASSGQAR